MNRQHWAKTNPGHCNFRQLADAVKRGGWTVGGFPMEVNTMSICEVFFDISSLICRNLLSMSTEELRSISREKSTSGSSTAVDPNQLTASSP